MNGNGKSLTIDPGWDKDPLRKKKHHVLASDDGGKTFTIIGETADPIELLKIQVEGQHAIGMAKSEMLILDEERIVVAKYEALHVDPQEGPPTPERLKVRDRWLDAVMKFLLPLHLFNKKDDADYAPVLKNWFRKKRIEIQMRPDGGAVRVFRKGELLTSWGC